MKLKEKCRYLCSASAIIFMLGVIRGIGGVADMLDNAQSLLTINYGFTLLIMLTIICIVLSAASFIIAIALFEQDKSYIFYGMLFSMIFVLYTLMQDYFVLDRSISDGGVVNLIAAGLAVSLLVLSKRSLDKQ